MEPDTIHDCKVTRIDALTEPVLVDWDEKTHPILPKWQSAQGTSKETVGAEAGESPTGSPS